MRRRRVSAVIFAAALGACRASQEPLVPLRHLVDEPRAGAAATEPPALTLGNETRYVLGPRVPARVTRIETLADGTGSAVMVARCPPELAGGRAQLVVESAEVVTGPGQRPESLDLRYDQRAIRCPGEPAGGVPVSVAGHTRPGPIVMTAVVSALPTAHAAIEVAPVPQRARLRVAVGVRRFGSPPAGATVHAALRAESASGARLTLWQGTLAVPAAGGVEAWREVEVPLEPARVWLGPSMRLVFDGADVRGNGYDALVAWGDPVIWGPSLRHPPPPWNVLVVSLDTLRADRLGAYGYPLPVSPVLDRFARDGTLFERAVTQATWTLPSHATMLTGTYPCVHGVGRPEPDLAPQRVPPGIVPLAQALREAGFATAAFTEDAYVDADVFQRGFGSFRADRRTDSDRTGGMVEETVAAAVDWLRQRRGDRFFLFVHTYQVHQPYSPPPAYARRVPSDPLPLPRRGVPPSPAMRQQAARYVAEVAYTDATLEALFTALDVLGLTGRTIVLVTSDHGEAFGEHRAVGHGTSLFEEEAWVPMLWRAPGLIAAGRRVPGLAGLVDVTPTVLDLVGLPVPPWMQGRSLKAELSPGAAAAVVPGRVLPLQGHFRDGVRGHGWKVVRTRGKDLFFDLRKDPGEKQPLRDARRWSATVERARRQLAGECARGLAALGPAGAGGAAQPIDPERARKLRALGYAQ